MIQIVIGSLGKIPIRFGEEPGRIGNLRKYPNHPDYSIVEVGQNNEMSFGHLRRLAFIQNPVKRPLVDVSVKKHARSKVI